MRMIVPKTMGAVVGKGRSDGSDGGSGAVSQGIKGSFDGPEAGLMVEGVLV